MFQVFLSLMVREEDDSDGQRMCPDNYDAGINILILNPTKTYRFQTTWIKKCSLHNDYFVCNPLWAVGQSMTKQNKSPEESHSIRLVLDIQDQPVVTHDGTIMLCV